MIEKGIAFGEIKLYFDATFAVIINETIERSPILIDIKKIAKSISSPPSKDMPPTYIIELGIIDPGNNSKNDNGFNAQPKFPEAKRKWVRLCNRNVSIPTSPSIKMGNLITIDIKIIDNNKELWV